MAKTPPRLPWGPKPSKAGSGLSQLFPAETLPPNHNAPTPDDELPTPMRPPPLAAPIKAPRKRTNLPPPVSPPQAKNTVRCEACQGSTFEEFKRVDVPGYASNAPAKSSDFGMYRFVTCKKCAGSGRQPAS